MEEANVSFDSESFPMNKEREEIIKSCHSGNIDNAVDILMTSFPSSIQKDPEILFVLFVIISY